MPRELNCALLAHVDAGKTTLSEALLFAAGALRKAGRVDHRDTFLDSDPMERERGITVFSKQARLNWKGQTITLLDTPGHQDLSGEMERTLRAADCAVLLLSGPEGVQSHTRTLWRILQQYRLPVLIFVNKIDMSGFSWEKLNASMRRKLSDGCIRMDAPEAEEEIAFTDEEALEEYTNTGRVNPNTKQRLIRQRKLFPVFLGSALKMQGHEALLNALCEMPLPAMEERPFGARVYKISRDKQDKRLTWLKVTSGTLHARDVLHYVGRDGLEKEEKCDTLRLYSGEKFEQTDQAEAGCICAVTGLENTYAGLGIGSESGSRDSVLEPVFTYRAAYGRQDAYQVLKALRRLEEEDPLLRVSWQEQLREIRVSLMGDVHGEVLLRTLKERFGAVITLEDGGILYKETILTPAEGVGHYEPLRHYAEVHLLLEPLPRGSGLRFLTAVSEDKLERNWQRLILTHLYEKQHLGVLAGKPITDMSITLIAGKAHLKHTEGGDFRQATYRAVRNGLMQAQSVLLEPVYDFSLTVPENCAGRAMTDLERFGASFASPVLTEEGMLITGRAPAGRMKGYLREVIAYTGNRGRLECMSGGYEPCRDQETLIRAIGYDPLRDTENTPDSVFCSHGAGFTVPWNEVKNYMHLEAMREAAQEEEAAAPRETAASAKKSTLEEDQELLRIFERTYGPIKPRAFDKPPKTAPVLESKKIIIPETEYLIVDGYNVIFSWEELKEIARIDLEGARHMLTEILCNYQGVRSARILLVFDAYKVKNNPGKSEKYKNITVIYTAEAETADSFIEKYTLDLARPYRARVVTSDGLEQIITMGHGALRTSAREFKMEVEAANVEIRQLLESSRSTGGGQTVAGAMRRAVQKKAVSLDEQCKRKQEN